MLSKYGRISIHTWTLDFVHGLHLPLLDHLITYVIFSSISGFITTTNIRTIGEETCDNQMTS
jgi:hypothetical protein